MKKLGLVILLLLLIVGGVVYYMFNKEHVKAEDLKAEAIAAETLIKDYNADAKKADAAYLGKVLDVSGTVIEASTNESGLAVITLGNPADAMNGVQCTMREKGVSANVGDKINVKGFCSGYTMVIVLSNCIIAK